MDDHLSHLDLFLEADSRWTEGADGFLPLLAVFEEGVRGGGCHSNELNAVGVGVSDLCNDCIKEHSVEVVPY